ncbi:MAG: hypothetical protein DWQ07_09785 [Chloroflexi bacterium]|nr:MAG: hypothetical protein DWQ07_09785 [Chloroflexota bacterium]MBL1192996.1 hypothetical protein [Chloroflexota bacterium]
MTLPGSDPTYRIYLALAQYPIFQRRIRNRMLRQLYERGIFSSKEFDTMVREQAILSQAREGLTDPFGEEPAHVWKERVISVRNYLIDLHFAQNLSFELFEDIVRQALAERGAETDEIFDTVNPELAPQEVLFEQALAILNMPEEERKEYKARLQEIKVVLIRNMISDQLAYINIAKDWFKVSDLVDIRKHKIGAGKIGGKAAGMLLAERILKEVGNQDVVDSIYIPPSYFLGADVMYAFMVHNDLMKWADQKYKTEEEMHADYPTIQEEYTCKPFPPDSHEQLEEMLERIGDRPIIVRSSSLLEDNFGMAFAGKYDSHFCPNQGSPEENLKQLICAISSVYASALNPDALLYRRSMGLQDYDERIAVLIQVVQGEQLNDYYLPHAAGVAFSRNLFRWSPQIEREAGFVRLVWGLGTRAVDRVGEDYPRIVALSHPLLHPAANPKDIRNHSQQHLDLIDIQNNEMKTLPVGEVFDPQYPILRYIAQSYQDGFLAPIRSNFLNQSHDLVLTFDELLRRTPFADRMRRMLATLQEHYRVPVDLEFTLRVRDPRAAKPEVDIFVLQCRPQSQLAESNVRLPHDLDEERIIFATERVVPHGHVKDINYVLFVPPEGYYALPDQASRSKLGRAIGRLNAALKDETFICIGPGRWGTVNPDLGVKIGYSDIYHSQALVELSGDGVGPAPEPSFGTHFFQDLMEAQIFPLAVYLDDAEAIFKREFFYDTPNSLAEVSPSDAEIASALRLIKVADYQPDHHIELIMDDEANRAAAFLAANIANKHEERT